MDGDEMGTGCGIIALFVLIAMFALWGALAPVDTSNGAMVTITETETVRHGETSGGDVVVVLLSSLGAAVAELAIVLCGGGVVGWLAMALLVLGVLGLAGSYR